MNEHTATELATLTCARVLVHRLLVLAKEVLSLLWAELFEGWGNGNNKTGTVEKAVGQQFLPQGERTRICFEQGSERRG